MATMTTTVTLQERKCEDPKSLKSILMEPIPLENTWSFWLDRYSGPGLTLEQYEANLIQLGSFSAVQDFWRWFNNLPTVDKLAPRTSYHIMKKGVKPLWEHEANVNGGNLAFRISKDESKQVWLKLVLSVIGEQLLSALDEEDDVCGITISIRKAENVVDIWNKRAEKFNIQKLTALVQQLLPGVVFLQTPSYNVHKAQEDFVHAKH